MQACSRSLFQLDQDYFMIRLCHNMLWYSKDLYLMNPDIKVNQKADIDQILSIFSTMFTEKMQKDAV